MTKTDVYQSVTDRIIDALESGTVPWRKPWRSVGGPVNVRNGRPYRGINVFLLALAHYGDPRWGTFAAVRDEAIAEARRNGREIVVEEVVRDGKTRTNVWEIVNGERKWFSGGVRKGEKGTRIILWKPIAAKQNDNGDNERDGYLLLREYVVFNAEQCDGLSALDVEATPDFVTDEQADAVVAGYVANIGGEVTVGPHVDHGYDGASYSPLRDVVMMPHREQFDSPSAYYSTLFHELVHSTGHESRLDRIEPATFGSDPYAREELVAEMGAAMLDGLVGIEDEQEQSAAYIAGWLRKLKDDRELVVRAAAQAQRASDLIVGTTFEDDETSDNVVAAVTA